MKLFVAIYLTIAILYSAFDIASRHKASPDFHNQFPIYWAPHIIMLIVIWSSLPWH